MFLAFSAPLTSSRNLRLVMIAINHHKEVRFRVHGVATFDMYFSVANGGKATKDVLVLAKKLPVRV